GAWTTFREASQVYGRLGHGERVALFEYEDKHGFSRPRREAALRWMRRWLLGIDDAPSEDDFKTFTDEQLQCTRSGQVLEDFKGRSVFHLNAIAAKELAPARAKFPERPEADRQQELRRLLGVPTQVARATERKPDAAAEASIALETEPGIVLPARIDGDRTKARRLTVYLSDRGLAEASQPGGPLAPYQPRG